MASEEHAALADQLRTGWVVVGFSSNIVSAGAVTHSILLQRDDKLEIVGVVVKEGQELSRTVISLAS